MTVFSSVTATLSPELASCMKAKGKSWKEAFFNSLRTLVGVEYTCYKRENQWQIKGEWDGVKKAFNILSKVAVIEKDAIAAYHAEASELATTRASRLQSRNQPELAGQRRRGRPPKKRPYVQPPVEPQPAPLPPKRKRGRPRKVEVKEESEEEDNAFENDTFPAEVSEQQQEQLANSNNIEVGGAQLSIQDANSAEPVDPTVHQKLPVDLAQSQNQLSETNTPEKIVEGFQSLESKGLAQKEIQLDEAQVNAEPIHETAQLVKVEVNHEDKEPRIQEHLQQITATLQTEEVHQEADNARIQEAANVLVSVMSEENQKQPEEIPPAPEHQVHLQRECAIEHPENRDMPTDDQFADIAMQVAKEASACANSSTEAVSNLMMPPIQGVAAPHISNMAHDSVVSELTGEATNSSSIFEYLGIKHKNPMDDFTEDDKFSGEQSKKLEELIEKMIEKMDKTLKEPKPQLASVKYICTECPFTSHRKAILRDHMKKTHTEELEPEEESELPEEEEEEEEEAEPTPSTSTVPHKKFTVNRKLYRCFECNYSSNSRKHLKEHKMRKHREKALECDICQKKFAVERDLTRHMKDHKSGDERHACHVCGKKYKQLYVLKRHVQTHNDNYVKPMYPCEQCPKSFSAKQVLQIHITSVHLGQRPSFPCPTCDKTFTTKHSLAEHQMIHTNVKPYECTICKKSFRHESTLKTHERLHTDTTQQFTCEYCGKAFRLRSSLRIHRNIHTGDKRFDCPVCKKVFTQKQSLLRHLRIHTGEKPFQCEICGSAFYDYSILRRHVTGVHKMQWKSPTQHYVLPPGSYQDGKVIEQPPQNSVSTVIPPQAAAAPPVGGPQHVGEDDNIATYSEPSHPTHQHPVYQPSPMPHTPTTTLPEPPTTATPVQVEAHNLTTRHLMLSDSHALARKVLIPGSNEHSQHMVLTNPQTLEQKLVSASGDQTEGATYHSSLVSVSPSLYQSSHLTLASGMPSSIPLTQQQPLQSQTPPIHPSATLQSPPPTQQAMSPLSPMSLSQYQQSMQSHSSGTPHPPLPPSSAYTLNQQVYYQSHP